MTLNGASDVPDSVLLDSSPVEATNEDIQLLEAPYVGMSFNSFEEAKKYYKEYGQQQGFETRVRSAVKRQSHVDVPSSGLLVCSREGIHNKKEDVSIGVSGTSRNTSTVRCDCRARMRLAKKKLDNIYTVTLVENNHSHGLVSPYKRGSMRSNKSMPEAAKNLTEIFDNEGLPVAKVASVFSGDAIGLTSKMCQNYSATRKKPKENDATAVLDYFKQKSAENPQFYYAVQLDPSGTAVNFFWIEGRSRVQYEYFGDVVSFDTTYRTNIYEMPFAPFTGVNHHLQSIQFGCALLLDETEETFVWLFQTWLAAMGGRPPTSILTDQDRAMTGAIAKVFPSTQHRHCFWHVSNKFSEKLGHVYHKNNTFATELNFVLKSYRIDDFESKWPALMVKYDLVEHSWLNDMYELRRNWVRVYHLDTFFAGMNTTGRSESMNSYYDNFVSSTTTLMQFVHGNERSLELIAKHERDFDYNTEHKCRNVGRNEFLLKHAGKVYTINVFNKFKSQMENARNCYKIVEEEVDRNGTGTYFLKSRKPQNTNVWKVSFDRTTLEAECECKYFKFMGIPCAHLLKIFLRYDVEEIPAHFILKRWTQKANTYRVVFDGGLVNGHGNQEALRVFHCIKVSTQLAYDAATNVESYAFFIEKMSELSIGVAKCKETLTEAVTKEGATKEGGFNLTNEKRKVDIAEVLILNPNISQTKGRNKRIKSSREIAQEEKNGRFCKSCQKIAKHDSRNCPEKIKNATSNEQRG